MSSLGIAGSDADVLGLATGAIAAAFDANVWTLMVIPFVFFVLAFIVKGNVERFIIAVIGIIASSVMVSTLVDEYDVIYAVPLMLMIFGLCLKVLKEAISPGR